MKTIFTSLFFFFFTSLVFEISAQIWAPKAPGILSGDYYVSGISIVSDQVIWAVAYDYAQADPPVPPTHITKLLKSTDGGETWDVKDIEEAMGRVSLDIHAFDENTACISTQNFGPAGGRGIFRTTDGGENWTEVLSGNVGGVQVYFFDDQEGICINRDDMARTTDGGVSWDSGNISGFQPGEFGILVTAETSLEVLGDLLWFGTTKGRVFKSYDRGNIWNPYASGLGDTTTIFSIAFVDEKNGIALYFNDSGDNQLAKSSDGGESWTPVGYDYKFNEVIALPCSRVFMGVSWQDSITAISTDFGETWELLDDQTAPWTPTFTSPNLGWMGEGALTGADNAALYKWVGNPLYGRTYVNQNANGNNDGSSWADAYTELQDALAAAEEGDEIWVAEGNYLPGNDPTATFLIDKDLKLYGGFAGTECNLSERDVEMYPTILSGDLNSDDVDDDFVNFKSDNAHTVVRITSSTTDATLLDGFTIRDGHADGDGQIGENGGGIYSDGTPNIRNCTFEQNYALVWGGAVAQFDYSGSAVIIDHCHFNNNNSGEIGLALVIVESLFDIRFCTFTGNIDYVDSPLGTTLVIRDPYGGTVWNCRFENNQSAFAPGLLVWRNIFNDPGNVLVEILDCEFNNNIATGPTDDIAVANMALITNGMNSNFVVKRCTFNQNNGSFAGAISLNYNPVSTNASMLIDSCEFTLNTSQGTGGTIYTRLAGDNLNLEIRNSHFMQNTVDDSFGYGTVSLRGGLGNGIAVVDNCVFEENEGKRGGAIWLHGGGDFTDFQVKNSVFRSNEAISGGAIEVACSSSNIQTNVTIEDCAFTDNTSTTVGGAINLTEGCNIVSRISGCTITSNESPKGGAIHAQHQDGSGSTAFLENCLIANNSSDNAAIFSDSYDLTLLNNTIADNNSNGIEIANQSSLSIQNTILFNPGYTELEELTNDVTVISNGGNLLSDNSLGGIHPDDIEVSDPLFAGGDDYQVLSGSPCIDGGNNDGVTAEFDLAGNARIIGSSVDIGAYESLFTSVKEEESIPLSISPNPATDFLNIHLPENISQPFEVSLFDLQGRLIRHQIISDRQVIDLKDWAGGMYIVKATIFGKTYAGRFVKQ